MTDEEMLERFSAAPNAPNNFKQKIDACIHPDNSKELFCELARAINQMGMDWYFTRGGKYKLRFGITISTSIKNKNVGVLCFTNNTIQINLHNWPEFKNLNDIISNEIFLDLTVNDKSVPLTSEIISLFTSTQDWPENHLGTKQQIIGKWPDANTNDSEPTTSKNEEITMKIGLNTILYGPPGTGKTYSVIDYSHAITNKASKKSEEIKSELTPDIDSGESEEIKYEITLVTDSKDRESRKSDFDEKIKAGQIRFVTFHQSFSYEEFVEGIRAKTTSDGHIHYDVKPGIFKQICDDAKAHTEQNYVLIIDEINRGNISKIFGELITLIEPSKRQGGADELVVILPYTQEPFSVPDNLYIIGTMNTADRSLALMDTALRRRFDFVEMPPQPELLKDIEIDEINICTMLTTMNQRIEVLYDREHTLGHAFFMSLNNDSSIGDLAEIFQHKIIPLLQEYFFEDWEKIRIVLGDNRKDNEMNQFIIETAINKTIFTSQIIELYNLENSKSYKINQTALNKAGAYLQIYS